MSKRVLIISGDPPGNSNVAGLSTAGFLPALEGGHVCCAAISPSITHDIHPSIPGDRVLFLKRRYETGWRYGPPGINVLAGHLAFRAKLLPLVRAYSTQIVHWARKHEPHKLWAVTDSLIVIFAARLIAKVFGIPIYTHILDIAEHECSRRMIDRLSAALVMREFKSLLHASKNIGVVSGGMAEHYASWGNNNFVVMRHGVSPSQGADASAHLMGDDVFRIGFSGSLYALDAWAALLAALDELQWRIEGRRIIIRLFGAKPPPLGYRPANIEWMGWRQEREVVDMLSTCDICYLPYPFGAKWRDVVRTSFATKYSAYAATGRPVLVHAPAESSIALFCAEHGAGFNLDSLDTAAIVCTLKKLQDKKLLGQLEAGARDALNGPLSAKYNLTQFRKFMDLEEQ